MDDMTWQTILYRANKTMHRKVLRDSKREKLVNIPNVLLSMLITILLILGTWFTYNSFMPDTAILKNDTSEVPTSRVRLIRAIQPKAKGKNGRYYSESGNKCMSEACVLAASVFLSNMDSEKNPCDDFYEFACGNYKYKEIPDDKALVNVFTELNDKSYLQLRKVLEPPIEENEPTAYKQIKTYYQACMNEREREARGLTPLLQRLQQVGGWPVIEGKKWNESAYDWKMMTYALQKLGMNSDFFISIGISADYDNSTMKRLLIGQGILDLSTEFLREGFKNKYVKEFYNHQINVATILGAKRKRAERELHESVKFAIELSKISSIEVETRNMSSMNNKMTIREIQQKFPSVPWLEYMTNLLPQSLNITEDELVIVELPKYVEKLEGLLSKIPKRVQANWIIWISVVSSSLSFLNNQMREAEEHYSKFLTGTKKTKPRWQECVEIVNNDMPIGVGSSYVNKFIDKTTKITAAAMFNEIRNAVHKKLNEVDWMDATTRAHALEKAKRMILLVGYPDEYLDMNKVANFYRNVNTSIDNFFDIQPNLRLFYATKELKNLRKPLNKTIWTDRMPASIINAGYQPQYNVIEVPAGILSGHFYSNERPNYLNFGAIGTVVGHEITHGFDDTGRQFDKDGNLNNWWANSTEVRFLNKTACMVKQYSNYTIEEIQKKLNGLLTLGENIADNGGIKEAYNAYLAWSKKNRPEPTLPGLPFNSRQLFWISASNTWCTKYRPESLLGNYEQNNHAPGKLRIIGSLSNAEEFSRDFKCPLGSPMNPVKKCKVW